MAEPVLATKKTVEQIFDGAAPVYDRVGPALFQQFGAWLVERMAVAQGVQALDVATGTGAVLIPLARRVGPSGRVIGIDLSGAMLTEAERAVRAAGLSQVDLRKMDGERLEFPDETFDVVACGFALFFFAGMSAALREMRRVLKRGGQVGLTMWGKAPFDPAWKIFADQARAYGVEVRMPNKIAYASEEIHALLAEAGFGDIEVKSETTELVYAYEEDWWAFQFSGGTRAALERMDEGTRARFKAEYLAQLRPLFQADGLHLPAPVLYAVANRQ